MKIDIQLGNCTSSFNIDMSQACLAIVGARINEVAIKYLENYENQQKIQMAEDPLKICVNNIIVCNSYWGTYSEVHVYAQDTLNYIKRTPNL